MRFRVSAAAVLCAAIAAGVFAAAPAAACSVLQPPPPDPSAPPPGKYDLVRESIADSTLAITGRVTEVRFDEPLILDPFVFEQSYQARIRVSRIYKGMTGQVVLVRGDTGGPGTCGYGKLRAGQRLGLLLYGKRSPWEIDITSPISYLTLERATGGRSHRPRRAA